MRLRPLQDRVLIRRAEPEFRTPGGIFIPDAVQEKPLEGEVIAVGPGARRKDGALLPMDVEAGDRVLFAKWSGTAIKFDGEELTILAQAEIIGVCSVAPSSRNKPLNQGIREHGCQGREI